MANWTRPKKLYSIIFINNLFLFYLYFNLKGDTSYSYYVFEIAICALYMMLDATKPEGSCEFNQIEIAAHTIAGIVNNE